MNLKCLAGRHRWGVGADPASCTCAACGKVRPHAWAHGACTRCGAACVHPRFDIRYSLGPNASGPTVTCSVCRQPIPPEFFNKQPAAPAGPPAPPAPEPVRPRDEAADADMVRFACATCGKRLKAPASARGKTGACSKCQTRFVVPAADAPPPYTRRSGPAQWTDVFAELAAIDRGGDQKPQLWLLCQTPSMAVALMSKRPAPASALVDGVPELAEFVDGRAAAAFPVRVGADALPLLRALFGGDFGPDKPVVLGGAAVGAPPADLRQVLAMFGRGDALTSGTVAVW